MPSARVSVCLSVCHVFAQTLISHSFMNISSPNMQGMFMAIKTCLCNFFCLILKKKQNGRHSQLFKNNKVLLNLEIFQLALSYLHKRYMARKASLIVIMT